MFSKCLALNLVLCCLITVPRLEVLEAVPIPITEGSVNTEQDSGVRLAENQPEDALPSLGNTELSLTSRESKDSGTDIEALPVVADRGGRQVRSMGGLAPGLRLFPVNAGYPEEALLAARRSRTRRPKKPKNRLPAAKKAPKFRAEEEKTQDTDPPPELTISIPSYKTDSFGRWLYNPWGATFGKVWQDTRFHVNHQSRMPRIHVESDPGQKYYPDDLSISTVCQGRSTVYNRPQILEFLRAKQYSKPHEHHPILMDLRRELYRMARSEECHNRNLTDFLTYQICALQRNQRMEYLLPEYPKHQLR